MYMYGACLCTKTTCDGPGKVRGSWNESRAQFKTRAVVLSIEGPSSDCTRSSGMSESEGLPTTQEKEWRLFARSVYVHGYMEIWFLKSYLLLDLDSAAC